MDVNELDAIWYGSGGSGQDAAGPRKVVCTIVGFEHVGDELRAVAVPMTGGVPFSAPAVEFKVTDGTMRKP